MKNDKSIFDYQHPILVEIKNQILSGEVNENQQLPSIRELAIRCHLSCATVQKMYAHLKTKNYIYSIHGAGFYVLPNKHISVKDVEVIRHYLENINKLSQTYDLPMDEIIRFALPIENEKDEKSSSLL